jgi:heptosyltransferase-1
MRVLIVKTSSLGDLVHALPAVTDAHAARTQVRFDWLSEKAFAEIPAWHPAVERVIPCEMRRWRKNLWLSWRSGEWRRFRNALRESPYDLVLDAQGLFKSAFLASQARGPVAGHARENAAALFYDRSIPVPRNDHAVDRQRDLFAKALGYERPVTAPDFGLARALFAKPDLAQPYVVFLHATTWPTKCWPESYWQQLGRWFMHQGCSVVLPWGNEAERIVAERIATDFGGVVLPRMNLTAVAGVLAHAQVVVGVDTGLAHLAAAVNTPSVTLYGPTLPGLTGTIGRNQKHLCATGAVTVDRNRPNDILPLRVIEVLGPMLERKPE